MSFLFPLSLNPNLGLAFELSVSFKFVPARMRVGAMILTGKI